MLLCAIVLGAGTAVAQRWRVVIEPNAAYDAQFTFVRVRYTVHGRSGWEFDYPAMERNLMTMLRELTTVAPHVQASNVHTLDDPELLKHPVAYISEPGYWIPSEAEVVGLRNYLAKAGSSLSMTSCAASGITSSGRCCACCRARGL